MMKEKLNQYAENITSQYGEDGIIKYIIEHANGDIIKSACEFGAWDGKHLSNIFTLWHKKDWRAYLIEGDPQRHKDLEKSYGHLQNIDSVCVYLTSDGENSLDQIFLKNDWDVNLGLLSIDIDSYDYHIWAELEHVNPQIVVIEYNSLIPPYIDYHDPKGENFLRCSIKALENLGNKKGYKLISSTVTNAFFIKQDLFNKEKFPDMPAEYLFDYEGNRKNKTLEPVVVGSQLITAYPVFSSPPPTTIKVYYNLRKLAARFFKGGPKRLPPSDSVKDQLRKSGLFY